MRQVQAPVEEEGPAWETESCLSMHWRKLLTWPCNGGMRAPISGPSKYEGIHIDEASPAVSHHCPVGRKYSSSLLMHFMGHA